MADFGIVRLAPVDLICVKSGIQRRKDMYVEQDCNSGLETRNLVDFILHANSSRCHHKKQSYFAARW